ncbi:MAG TPA: hypothetical protein VMB26_08040 [Candidatus Binataceae bacterium]|nr:hypothetical protein [Candidatus Binataceae bacterium]
MFRVLVTDASYKHTIALARHAKKEIDDLYIIGHTTENSRFAGWYSCFDSVISNVSLEHALWLQDYDMIIPVGGSSVLSVAASFPTLAVLPQLDHLELCYDKPRTMQFAESIAVPIPRTRYVERADRLKDIDVPFPCVVKPSREATSFKAIDYCHSHDDLANAVKRQLTALEGEAGVVVQEFVAGNGCGFFALMDHGSPMRVFMHQRIREFPPSGGRSTAARAFHSERLKELGLRLLSSLKWHGVAMVEFKRSTTTGDFVLMEINGKFWGSLELGLAAGINFGADLIRLFRGEKLAYHEDYDRNLEFYWPLDDDMLTLWKTRSLTRVSDYWKRNAHTNMFQSLRADMLKSLRLAKMVLIG